MALEGLRITVGTTPTVLSKTSGFTDQINYNQNGQSILIQNESTTTTVYLGASSVTTSAYGHALLPETSISVDLPYGEHLYGLVATGNQVVNVLRSNV